MKKFFTLLICVLAVFSTIACSNEAVLLTADTSCWNADKTNYEALYEKSVYKVVKKNGAGIEVANGTLTYVLETDHKNEETGFVYSRVTADFSITYNDNAESANKGKTDTVTSKTVFNATVLLPTYSEKTVTLADREGVTNNSYSLTTDYGQKISKLSWTKNGKAEQSLSFAGQQSDVYENDMLYFVVRGISDIKPGASTVALKIANLFENHLNGKYTPFTFNCSVSGKNDDEPLSYPTLSNYLDGTGSVAAMNVTLSLAGNESGPSIKLKYATTPFKLAENVYNERVLLSIVTTEYNVLQAAVSYTTECVLTEYSVEKPQL